MELKNAPVVQTQSFPDGVAALDSGVKWTDSGIVAINQAAVDVDDQVAIGGIKFLQHRSDCSGGVRRSHIVPKLMRPLQKSILVKVFVAFAAPIVNSLEPIWNDSLRWSVWLK